MITNVKILLIGSKKWATSFQNNVISKLSCEYAIELISNKTKARQRLTHNSYDILILEDGFIDKDSIKLTMMAYAMSKPSLIICKTVFALIKYNLQKIFSKFFKKYKFSKQMICFNFKNKNAINKIIYLVENYKDELNTITNEISNATNI